jgi:hypothetical protein
MPQEAPDYRSSNDSLAGALEWIRGLGPEDRVTEIRFGIRNVQVHARGRHYWFARVEREVGNGQAERPSGRSDDETFRKHVAAVTAAWTKFMAGRPAGGDGTGD